MGLLAGTIRMRTFSQAPSSPSGTLMIEQHAIDQDIAGTAHCNWPAPTTAGSLLVSIGLLAGGSSNTFTTPSGWTAGPTVDNGLNIKLAMFYKENAASRSGTESITLSGAAQSELVLIEVSGAAASSSLDGTGTNTGTGSTGGSGSVTTAHADDIIISAIGYGPSVASFVAQNSPTNGFTLLEELQVLLGFNHYDHGLLAKIVGATGTYSTATTINKSVPWAGVIAAFKKA